MSIQDDARDRASALEMPDRGSTHAGYGEYLKRVLRELYERGETDFLEGGVPACRVAEQTTHARCTVYDHLKALDGIERVDGVDETGQHRKSFRPAREEPDGPQVPRRPGGGA
jgi:hypothetical protein